MIEDVSREAFLRAHLGHVCRGRVEGWLEAQLGVDEPKEFPELWQEGPLGGYFAPGPEDKWIVKWVINGHDVEQESVTVLDL